MIKRAIILQDEQLVIREIERHMQRKAEAGCGRRGAAAVVAVPVAAGRGGRCWPDQRWICLRRIGIVGEPTERLLPPTREADHSRPLPRRPRSRPSARQSSRHCARCTGIVGRLQSISASATRRCSTRSKSAASAASDCASISGLLPDPNLGTRLLISIPWVAG